MILSTDGDGPNKRSKNGLSLYYIVFHPVTSQRLYIWLPKSQVKQLSASRIEIPQWLWYQKKTELGI